MSAFLGPIHHWLYRKIQLQEALTGALLETARRNGWEEKPEEKLDAACGAADSRPLEQVIDQGNIHGWLQERIAAAETRFAFLVTDLLKGSPARLEELERAAYRFGQEHAAPQGATAPEAFQTLTDSLLDGMPCDHVNRVLETEENRVLWERTNCLHREYWESAGGDGSIYDRLREALIMGILSESGLEFRVKDDGVYEIRKGDTACTA